MAVKKRLKREKKRVYKNKKEAVFGIAWYKSEQWELLKKISLDADQLENTYVEWLEFAQKKLLELQAMGYKFEKVEVDVGELLAWCNERSLPVNSDSRAEFVTFKLQNR